jgi:hypothetical protein
VATAPSSRMWPSIWAENWYNIALPLQHIQTNASNELVVSHYNKVEQQQTTLGVQSIDTVCFLL